MTAVWPHVSELPLSGWQPITNSAEWWPCAGKRSSIFHWMKRWVTPKKWTSLVTQSAPPGLWGFLLGMIFNIKTLSTRSMFPSGKSPGIKQKNRLFRRSSVLWAVAPLSQNEEGCHSTKLTTIIHRHHLLCKNIANQYD